MRGTRHNGRTGKNGVYDPKHNDRRFNIEHSDHIRKDDVLNNIYWDYFQGYVALSSAGFATFIIGLNNLSGGAFRLQSGGLMILGILLLFVFSRLQLTSDKPMLNLKVFKYSSFRIGVFLTICLYLIGMGNGVILPILAKTICGYSDTAYGFATIIGAFISVFATLFAGKIYDKLGLKPMAVVSIVAFSVFTVLGLLVTKEIRFYKKCR